MCIYPDSDDSSKTVTPTEQRTPVREKENGGITPKNKSEEELFKSQKDKEDKESDTLSTSLGEDEVDGIHRRFSSRVSSDPPSFDQAAGSQLTPDNSSTGSRDRPLSIISNDGSIVNKRGSMYGSGSDVSVSDTPQQRKVRDRISASPRLDVRRVSQ